MLVILDFRLSLFLSYKTPSKKEQAGKKCVARVQFEEQVIIKQKKGGAGEGYKGVGDSQTACREPTEVKGEVRERQDKMGDGDRGAFVSWFGLVWLLCLRRWGGRASRDARRTTRFFAAPESSFVISVIPGLPAVFRAVEGRSMPPS